MAVASPLKLVFDAYLLFSRLSLTVVRPIYKGPPRIIALWRLWAGTAYSGVTGSHLAIFGTPIPAQERDTGIVGNLVEQAA